MTMALPQDKSQSKVLDTYYKLSRQPKGAQLDMDLSTGRFRQRKVV